MKSPAMPRPAHPEAPRRLGGREAAGAGCPQPLPKRRLLSLDAFRGFVVAGMLLVNNMLWNDATPRQFMHAPWGRGVTFTDLILPWFVFAMGVAVPMGTAAGARTAGSRGLLRILRRVLVLVGLGVLLDSIEARQFTAGMDVLQLLGLSYAVAAVLGRTPVWTRLAAAGALMGGFWALLALAPVPGYGAGVLQQQHNIIQYLNDAYLARWGLAGVFSVAPAGALALLGTVAGGLLGSRRLGPGTKTAVLLAAGAALMAGGLVWARVLPLSKDLWTPSYALLSGGTGSLLLGFCYLAFDVAGWRAPGAPFAVFGANAIAAYVGPILFVQALQYWHVPSAGGATASLQAALLDALRHRLGIIGAMWAYTGGIIWSWWLVLRILYRRRILIRV